MTASSAAGSGPSHWWTGALNSVRAAAQTGARWFVRARRRDVVQHRRGHSENQSVKPIQRTSSCPVSPEVLRYLRAWALFNRDGVGVLEAAGSSDVQLPGATPLQRHLQTVFCTAMELSRQAVEAPSEQACDALVDRCESCLQVLTAAGQQETTTVAIGVILAYEASQRAAAG